MHKRVVMGLVLAAGLGLTSPALAAPTYLECKLSYLDGAVINLALDEQARKVTWSRDDAAMVSDAAFSADKVSWKTQSGMMFVVSRDDLSLTRTDLDENTSDVSRCSLARARKRAF